VCFLPEFGTGNDFLLRSGAGDGNTQLGATKSSADVLEANPVVGANPVGKRQKHIVFY